MTVMNGTTAIQFVTKIVHTNINHKHSNITTSVQMTLGNACSLNDKHCTYITPLKITKKDRQDHEKSQKTS